MSEKTRDEQRPFDGVVNIGGETLFHGRYRWPTKGDNFNNAFKMFEMGRNAMAEFDQLQKALQADTASQRVRSQGQGRGRGHEEGKGSGGG